MAINMKKLAKLILFSCLSACSLSFSACKLITGSKYNQNESENIKAHYATVTILLSNNEFMSQLEEPQTALSSSSSAKERTATPVLPGSITYSLTATKIVNGSSTTTTVSSDSSAQSDTEFPSQKKYMLKLPAGTWRVTATGKTNSQIILTGTSRDFTVAADGKYEEPVPVYFIADGVGKGRINLEISTTGTNIHHLIISGTGQSYLDKQFNVSNNAIKIYNSESNNIISGNYYPTLTFYNSEGAIVTIIKETFNIRNYLSTDTWYKTGTAIYLKEKTGSTNGEADFILTQAIIDTLENNTLYVKGEGAQSTLITGTASDSNDGTRVSPYLTLNAAIKRANELNNVNFDANTADSTGYARKNFTIFCDGNIGGTGTDSELTIEPQHNLNLTIESINATSPATITTPMLTIGGDQTMNITVKNLVLKGDVKLDYGNLTLDSVSALAYTGDSTKGMLSYNGGQLTVGGSTSFANGITINAADKKILVDSAVTSSTQTAIKAGTAAILSAYTESSVILEGAGSATDAGSYKDVSVSDLAKFVWENPLPLAGNTDYFALRLKTLDGKQKAVLEKTDFNTADIPIYNDISFVLTDFNPSGSSTDSMPPKYEYSITGYNSSTDKISGSITIKMYVKKGDTKLKKKDDSVTQSSTEIFLDSLSLALYGESETPIAPTESQPCTTANITETSGGTSTEYTVVTLTASNIRPGTYSLKMSAIIDGIPYSQQSAAIYASLGAN